MNNKLFAVCCISNPMRYKSRYRLHKAFEQHMQESGVILITVELQLGDRPFETTDFANPHHVQLRAGPESVLWVKESLLNIGFRHLSRVYPDWKYAAWIDADIQFQRKDWADETIAALQHYAVVQPWARAHDMDPDGHALRETSSFGWCFFHETPHTETGCGYALENVSRRTTEKEYHPGYAWATRRDAWDAMGGLIDWAPLGKADWHMAHGFAGNIGFTLHSDPSRGVPAAAYKNRVMRWGDRLIAKGISGSLGYVNGTIVHHWHGQKRNRFYLERDQALNGIGFDPDSDLEYNADGVLVMTGANPKLARVCDRYLRSRNEDSVDRD